MRTAAERRRYRAIYRKYKEFTMIPGNKYVGNLCLAAMAAEIPGSIVECGTWRGGMIAGIADVLGPGRRYYLFDSFEGLPPAKEIDGPAALAWQADTKSAGYFDNCTATEQEARAAMALSPAKDYQIVKGWFRETLPRINMPQPIALLRMDGDWYESTKCILDNLAPAVARGGLIIVDDYYLWDGCTQAVNEAAAMRKWRIQQYAGICYIVV